MQAEPLPGVTGVALPGGPLLDLTFADGIVTEAAPHDGSEAEARIDAGWADLRGYTVLPAAADPHAHLDKALSWDLINPPVGDLPGAVASWHEAAQDFTEEDILSRARDAAQLMLRNGTTAVCTHVDIYPGSDPQRGIRAIARLRDELADTMVIQIVALIPPSFSPGEIHDIAADAVAAGADLIGGAPHLAADPIAQTDALVDAAENLATGTDLHVDEFLGDRTQTIHRYAERVTGRSPEFQRTAGHCCRFSEMDGPELEDLAGRLREADIPVIALPATNLYLQSGGRAIAPLSDLSSHEVQVAAGGDNIRDPFNPTGRGDALETAALLVTAAHQSPAEALRLVTDHARAVMRLPPAGPAEGARADLLCIRGAWSEAGVIAAAPPDRTVISSGRIVSDTRTITLI